MYVCMPARPPSQEVDVFGLKAYGREKRGARDMRVLGGSLLNILLVGCGGG